MVADGGGKRLMHETLELIQYIFGEIKKEMVESLFFAEVAVRYLVHYGCRYIRVYFFGEYIHLS